MSNKYLTISIDTESDWFYKEKNLLTNIEGIHFMQELAGKYHQFPTYLVTYEVANDNKSVGILKSYLEQGRCEIGSHLHIWSTPPFENPNANNVDEKWIDGLQSEIDDDMLYRKLEALHNKIHERFGIYPKSYRAGRWDINRQTLEWLARNGYKVDSSVSPMVSWKGTKGVNKAIEIDTSNAPNRPYYPDVNDFTRPAENAENSLNLLQVPVTGIAERIYFNGFESGLSKKINRLLKNTGFMVHPNLQFRPSYYIPLRGFKKIVENLFRSDLRFFNMMFHSSEIFPGTSPYSKTDNRFRKLIKKIETVLSLANQYGINGIGLSEVIDYYGAVS